jgi:hypothetical protein
VSRVPGLLGGRIEEQVGARLTGQWAVGELVVGVEVPLEADPRHDRAVIMIAL